MIGEFPSPIPGRLTFTKAQLELPEIKELVELLIKISADGVLEYDEMQALSAWLNDHLHSEIPGVKYLIELMLHICRLGFISNEETFELQLGIERVLPKQYRDHISEKRKSVYYSQPASENQRAVIAQMTDAVPPVITRAQASEMITRLNSAPPASNRQIMFLRFWNRLDLCNLSRGEIAAWMSEFIDQDHQRWDAWEKFKLEYRDDGTQHDPSFVPIGASARYYFG